VGEPTDQELDNVAPEAINESNTYDDAGSDPFPDPVLDAEPTESEDLVPPVQAGEPVSPVAPPPPLPPPPPVPAWDPPAAGPSWTPPPAPAPQPTTQFYTLAQLNEAVATGLINDDQKATILQTQEREIIKQETLRAIQEEQRNAALVAQVQHYRSLAPGWDQVGTPANNRVNPIYQQMLQRGFPANEATKLEALERAFGTPHQIQQARQQQNVTAQARSTPQAMARRGGARPSASKVDVLKHLPKDQYEAYKRLIDQGHPDYKDWSAVRAEVEYGLKQTVNPKLREATEGLMRR